MAGEKTYANWWLWIAIDLVYVGEYVYKVLWPTAVLSGFLWCWPCWDCVSGDAQRSRPSSDCRLNHIVQRLAADVAAQLVPATLDRARRKLRARSGRREA